MSLFSPALALLRQLVMVPTPNPPGYEERLLDVLQPLLQEAGFDCQRVPLHSGRASLVAVLPGELPGLALFAHLDTVRAEEVGWETAPFELHARGSRFYGRGTADMKGGLAASVVAAVDYAISGAPRRRALFLALTADEEYGYGGARSIQAAGLLDNCRTVVITEPTENLLFCGQKGEFWLELRLHGKAAHGSVPETGVNAIEAALELASALKAFVCGLAPIPGRGRSSFNLGEMQGGRQVNVVPDRCTMRVDLRLVCSSHRERILAFLAERRESLRSAGLGLALEELAWVEPVLARAKRPDTERLLELLRANGEHDEPVLAPYSTDAVAFAPAAAHADTEFMIFGPGSIAQAHQPNEYIEAQSLRDFVDTLRAALELWCA
ncbi:MAG: M20 family metallopeptidase [Myxococcota bacterium]|nr:M20 family metallopeptidase [Myxococcota bacterium]